MMLKITKIKSQGFKVEGLRKNTRPTKSILQSPTVLNLKLQIWPQKIIRRTAKNLKNKVVHISFAEQVNNSCKIKFYKQYSFESKQEFIGPFKKTASNLYNVK